MKNVRFFNLFLIGLAAVFLVKGAGCKRMDRSQFNPPQINMIVSENLNGIAAVPPDSVWVFGGYGTMIHSPDGGKTWEQLKSGSENLLCDGFFPSESEGWVVGIAGTILHTADGGSTWESQESGTQKNLFRVVFTSPQEGWIVGDYGTVLHTVDGGKTWRHVLPLVDRSYNGVFFINQANGWIVGEFGTIIHTSDGGRTWDNQPCADIVPVAKEDEWEQPTPSLYDVHFVDERTGWCVGVNGIIIATMDGGKNWKKIESPCEETFYRIVMEEDTCWVVGARGSCVVSRNRGKTWKLLEDSIKTRFWLHDIVFVNASLGFIVGARGTIVVSKDGGEDWTIASGISYDMPEFGITDF
jgi:photosystem II stability/assembly factor-like uncharacterized protein